MVSKSKLTPKQHKFAELVAGGNSLSDSYRGAYNATNMKPQGIRNEASKLMANQYVTMMVDTLRGRTEAAIQVIEVSTRAKVLAKLEDLMNKAKTESVQLGAAVALGKSVALFTDVTQDRSAVKSIEEIDAEIKQRLAELEGMADREMH
jgi:hypothetical protein